MQEKVIYFNTKVFYIVKEKKKKEVRKRKFYRRNVNRWKLLFFAYMVPLILKAVQVAAESAAGTAGGASASSGSGGGLDGTTGQLMGALSFAAGFWFVPGIGGILLMIMGLLMLFMACDECDSCDSCDSCSSCGGCGGSGGPECGDDKCDNDEDCYNCVSDCGECDATTDETTDQAEENIIPGVCDGLEEETYVEVGGTRADGQQDYSYETSYTITACRHMVGYHVLLKGVWTHKIYEDTVAFNESVTESLPWQSYRLYDEVCVNIINDNEVGDNGEVCETLNG